jgi:hypothetical protein
VFSKSELRQNKSPKYGGKIKILTEPVMDGLRLDCWGAIIEKIFLETFFLDLLIENEACEEKDERPTSFCIPSNPKNSNNEVISKDNWTKSIGKDRILVQY